MEDPITSGISGLADAQPPDPTAPASAMPNLSTPGTAPQMATASAQQPAPQTSAPGAPAGPHAGLMSMIQGMMVGLGAFGKSIATQGREGGVEEVNAERRAAQDMALKQQANQRENEDHATRQKMANANLLMASAEYHHNLQMYPLQEREAALKLNNDATAAYNDALTAGYDLQDPGQTAAWSNLQNRIIKVTFGAKQNPDEVMSGVKGAAEQKGGSLVDYVPLVHYNDAKHGTGGEITLVPADGLQAVNATPRQVSTGLAEAKSTLMQATAAFGADNPDVKNFSGRIQAIDTALKTGGNISAYQMQQLKMLTIGPMGTMIGGKAKAEAIKKEQLANEAAARPKDMNDAVGRLTQAQQTFKNAPTPQNKLGVDASQAAVNVFQREEAKAAAQKTYATKTAELNAMDANEEKNLPTLIDAAKNYQLDPDKIFSMRGNQGAKFKAALLQADPTYSAATYKAKFNTVQDFSPNGSAGKQIQALNTFAGHAADAMGLVDSLRNSGSKLINAPMNKAAEAFGNDKIGPFNMAVEAAKDEYLNFLKAGHAPQKEEIERVEKAFSSNSSPAQIEANLKQMAATIVIRAGSLDGSYKATMGKNYPSMFTPEGASAMAKIGLPVSGRFGVGGQPAAATFDPKTDFKPIQ
jgi:hypothetical protein